MYKYCLLVLLIGIGVGCKPPAQDCQRFRTGTFLLDGEGFDYRITRTETEQHEINLKTKETGSWKVTWIDECSYTLSPLESHTERPILNKLMTVKITKTGKDFYYFDSQFEGMPSMTGRVRQVK